MSFQRFLFLEPSNSFWVFDVVVCLVDFAVFLIVLVNFDCFVLFLLLFSGCARLCNMQRFFRKKTFLLAKLF